MAEYRAYLIRDDGHFFKAIDLDCADDDAAKEYARQLADGHDVELWQLDRKVETFKQGSRRALKTPKPKNWNEAEQRQLKRMARQGAGTSEISVRLGRYAASVRRMAREIGLLLKK